MAPDFVVEAAANEDLPFAIKLVAREFPYLPVDADIVARVHAWSRSLLVIKRHGAVVGCLALLLLTERGLGELLDGAFNVERPFLNDLARVGEPAAAVYVWMFIAPAGCGDAAAKDGVQWLKNNGHGGLDIYGRAVTSAGKGAAARFGGVPVSEGSDFWVRRHAPN